MVLTIGKRLLSSRKECPYCSTASSPQMMNWTVRADVVDGYHWRCPAAACRKTLYIRKGTFFDNTRVSLQKWLILIYWWVKGYAVTKAMEEANVSKTFACDVYQWLREICSAKLLTMTITLGGPSSIVQIDESLFRHKPKVFLLIIGCWSFFSDASL